MFKHIYDQKKYLKMLLSRKNYEKVKELYHSFYRPYRYLHFHVSGEASRARTLKNKFNGKRCFIIGNGPSIKQQDLTLLRDDFTFVTNWFAVHENYEAISPNFYCILDHFTFGGWETPNLDRDLYGLMQERAKTTVKFFPYRFKEYIEKNRLFDREIIYYLLYEPIVTKQIWLKGTANLDLTKALYSGQNVITGFCIPIAYYLGFREIYLVGCDSDYGMENKNDDRSYFYEFKKSMPGPSYEFLKESWKEGGPLFASYEVMKRILDKRGCLVFNATKGGKLEVFPRVVYEDVVQY